MLRLRVTRSASWSIVAFGLMFVLGCLGGCSSSDRPPLGRVSGKVTYDSKPLAGVIINFQPDTGRAATCETDADGNYDLIYTYNVKGAKVGSNTVSFAWPTGAEAKVRIPPKYGEKSDIKVEVKSGRNTFDYNIESK